MRGRNFKSILMGLLFLTSSNISFAAEDEAVNFVAKISKIAVENDGKYFCLPPRATLNQIQAPLVEYLSKHVEKRNFTDLEIFQLIAQAFPYQKHAIKQTNKESRSGIEDLREQGYIVKNISPIFGQLVLFNFPKNFKVAYENTQGTKYTRESVLEGETVNHWSEMLTITGRKGLAENANLNPQKIIESIASGFKNACPDSFSAKGLSSVTINGNDAFIALLGCGTVSSEGDAHSEAAMIVAIKGASDYYTIQWAERKAPSNQPLIYNEAAWIDRFKKINPIKLCAIVPGEVAPYPSCINQ